jgi:hypothetical protein
MSRAYVDGQTEYEAATEAWLFVEVGEEARRRGYLTKEELLAVRDVEVALGTVEAPEQSS